MNDSPSNGIPNPKGLNLRDNKLFTKLVPTVKKNPTNNAK
jgi:hypothetical protein